MAKRAPKTADRDLPAPEDQEILNGRGVRDHELSSRDRPNSPPAGKPSPADWMPLSGRPQTQPDRNTRGYITSHGERAWLDVFPDMATG